MAFGHGQLKESYLNKVHRVAICLLNWQYTQVGVLMWTLHHECLSFCKWKMQIF